MAQELGLQEQLAYTLNDIHRSYSAVGSIASAQAVLAQAEMLWRKLDNPHMLADSLNSGAELAMLVGDYDTALTKAHEGDRVSTLVDNSWGKAYSAITLSLIYFEQGEFGAAIEAAGRSIAYAEFSGFYYCSVAALTCLSMIRAEVGDTQGSLAAAEQGVANATRLFSSVLGAVELAHATHALALVSAKRIADAERVMAPFRSALEVEHGQIAIAGILTAITWMAHGAIRLAKRDYSGVIRTTEGFINGLRGFAVHAFMADILLLRGQALRHLGQVEPARDAVEKGVQLCRSSGSCRALWPSLVEVALLDDAAGCHDEAAAHRAEAREIVRRLAAQAPEEVRATFLARSDVRALVNGIV
jgi:tetratricopeptide (TPR) repeat protein